jgi:hypothetical protein
MCCELLAGVALSCVLEELATCEAAVAWLLNQSSTGEVRTVGVAPLLRYLLRGPGAARLVRGPGQQVAMGRKKIVDSEDDL